MANGSRVLTATPPARVVASSASYRTGQVSGRCVCVFDFDETLRVNSADGWRQDVPAPEGRRVVELCRSRHFDIAVASANPHREKLIKILPRVDADVFNDTFFQTYAFQYGFPNKTIELAVIAIYLRAFPNCMVLFDDTYSNKVYADAAGVLFQPVNRSTGVRQVDYEHAMIELARRCNCFT